MPRYLAILLIIATLFIPMAAAAEGNVPAAADDISKQMDKQLMTRYAPKSFGGLSTFDSKPDYETRQGISIMATVPVSLNNLNVSCPLARQMTEEITRWMVNAGYIFEELRKGQDIQFSSPTGETLLTRDTARLATRNVTSAGVLVGTYVISKDQVRFNIRILHTPSNEVLAMGTATVPITDDIRPLLYDLSQTPVKVTPSIGTRLQ